MKTYARHTGVGQGVSRGGTPREAEAAAECATHLPHPVPRVVVPGLQDERGAVTRQRRLQLLHREQLVAA